MGSLWPFPGSVFSLFFSKERHEFRFLISLPSEQWGRGRWRGECRKSPNNVAFDEAVAPPPLSSASHSACGPLQCSFIAQLEHILSRCAQQSPRCSMTAENKKHYSLVLFVHFSFLPFSILSSFFAQSNRDWSKHNQPISATSRGAASPCGSQGSPAKFGAFQFSLLFFYLQWGEKDVSPLAEQCAFVGCRRLTHCRSFGNKPGRVCFSSRRLLFLTTVYGDTSEAPFISDCLAFLLLLVRN